MEFGLRFELSDNKFMQIKRFLVASLWFLMIVACASQKATSTAIATSHRIGIPTSATIMPTTTFVPVVYPNKFSKIGYGRIKFDNWHISFSLPEKWDGDRYFLGFQASPYTELYFFYGPEHDFPELAFDFRPFSTNKDSVDKYLKTFDNWTDGNPFKIEKYYSPKDMGLNLDTAVGYECTYTYGQNFHCFVLRAIYGDESIEMHLVTLENASQFVENLFLEVTNSISFEQ